MKMTKEHYNELLDAITGLIKKYPEGKHETYKKNFPDHSNMRYRWNLFHSINTRKNNFYYSRKLHEYLTDAHIDTALRKITGVK